MKGDPTIIAHLNGQLTHELTAINQYFLHARMYRHWGLERIGKKEYEESIEEMNHADKLINRILMLGGLPNLQALDKLLIGENALEMLQGDLQLEYTAQKTLKDGIAACEKAADYESRSILQDILDDTEGHIDWIETQIDLINKIGIQNYLQSQIDMV
jgi:bacterioferritin